MLSRTLTLSLALASGTSATWWSAPKNPSGYTSTGSTYINYTTVTGFFQQDDPKTNASTFDYTASNFGLINRSYPTDWWYDPRGQKTQWQRFEYYVDSLNQGADKNTAYKVLFLGRHGEGYHNAAESFYGTPAWNCYWAELDGNATVNWSDALLTPNGAAQAVKAHNFWSSQLSKQKMPAPQSYYTSPLSRCLITANLTFNGLSLSKQNPFVPIIKEDLREGISMHTCDRRSNKTYIHNLFPTWEFEEGFNEFDLIWKGVAGETSDAQKTRSKTVLDDLFSTDSSTWVSITSHSGEIGSILSVMGHISFSLSTGAVIPVLVKATVSSSTPPLSSISLWATDAVCAGPPVTSLATGGCVCSSTSAPAPTTTQA